MPNPSTLAMEEKWKKDAEEKSALEKAYQSGKRKRCHYARSRQTRFRTTRPTAFTNRVEDYDIAIQRPRQNGRRYRPYQ